MNSLLEAFLESSRTAGWKIIERNIEQPLKSSPGLERYKNYPSLYGELLTRISSFVNSSDTAWLVCEDEFSGESECAFKWNEWELMSLESANGDAELIEPVKCFWDQHIPLFYSVKEGYAFFAISLQEKGAIVHGREPEFESTTVVCDSLSRLMAHMSDPQGDPKFLLTYNRMF